MCHRSALGAVVCGAQVQLRLPEWSRGTNPRYESHLPRPTVVAIAPPRRAPARIAKDSSRRLCLPPERGRYHGSWRPPRRPPDDPPMRDADPFLAAITARPDDDLPRLIFADWLDEHGHADRAEFIRLQCAAVQSPPTRRRAAELEAAHRDEWLAELPGGLYHAEFHRGFAEHVVLPARAFLD